MLEISQLKGLLSLEPIFISGHLHLQCVSRWDCPRDKPSHPEGDVITGGVIWQGHGRRAEGWRTAWSSRLCFPVSCGLLTQCNAPRLEAKVPCDRTRAPVSHQGRLAWPGPQRAAGVRTKPGTPARLSETITPITSDQIHIWIQVFVILRDPPTPRSLVLPSCNCNGQGKGIISQPS